MAITAGTWQPLSQIGLNQQIVDHGTTQNEVLLKRVRCRDTSSQNYGEGEFVYLKGLASTAAGDLVVYNGDGVTTRTVARSTGNCAVAMSACVAGEFGWYQVYGIAKVKAATIAADKQLYVTATAGQVDDAVVTGDLVYGAHSIAADDTGFVKALLNFPNLTDTDNA